MTSIKGYTDLMLMGAAGEMSEAQRNYLQVIKNNASRLKLLVDDLLDISRIETGKTTLNREMIDLSEVIAGVVEGHLRGRIVNTEREINVRTVIPDGVPQVPADREKVTRILTNLVDNAFNYTRGSGEIAVIVHHRPDHIVVDVADTGIGIDEKNLDKIFDRFYRSEEDDVQMVPGTGLGLAIVQSLVAMHGGELNVKSEVGQGSTFSFSLPLVVEEKPTTE
jgi:two-component system phosphate regulon sensor histidine kinase PhoR